MLDIILTESNFEAKLIQLNYCLILLKNLLHPFSGMKITGSGSLPKQKVNKHFRQYSVFVLFIFFSCSRAFSQSYFQQEVNYKIEVKLNDREHVLNGYETIEYINNSPDTLNFLYFHLWPNAYSENSTDLAKELINRDGKEKLFNDPELRGFIDSLNFEVNGFRIPGGTCWKERLISVK